jgi:hypothetical protein
MATQGTSAPKVSARRGGSFGVTLRPWPVKCNNVEVLDEERRDQSRASASTTREASAAPLDQRRARRSSASSFVPETAWAARG